jgi:hypothetical protein
MPARAIPCSVTRTEGLLLPLRRYGLAHAGDIHRQKKKKKASSSMHLLYSLKKAIFLFLL